MKTKPSKKQDLRMATVFVFMCLAVFWIISPYLANGFRSKDNFIQTKANIGVTKRYAGEYGGGGYAPRARWDYLSTFRYYVDGKEYTDERSGNFPHEVTIYYDPDNPQHYVFSKTLPIKSMVIRGITILLVSGLIYWRVRADKKQGENLKKKPNKNSPNNRFHSIAGSARSE